MTRSECVGHSVAALHRPFCGVLCQPLGGSRLLCLLLTLHASLRCKTCCNLKAGRLVTQLPYKLPFCSSHSFCYSYSHHLLSVFWLLFCPDSWLISLLRDAR